MHRAKVSLRVTVLTTITTLLLGTCLAVWISASQGVRSNVESMAEALSVEALSRVEEKTWDYLKDAQSVSAATSQYLTELERQRQRPLRYSDLPLITSRLRILLEVYPQLSSLSVSFAQRGEYAQVERQGNSLVAVEMTQPVNGIATQTYLNYIGSERVVTRIDRQHHYDPRSRPYFKAAKQEGKAVWTDSYPIVEADGLAYPGLSFATPIHSYNRLSYVVSANFTSSNLSEFLDEIQVGRTGHAFVVDIRQNEATALIAHPNRDLLFRRVGKTNEIVRLQETRDPVLREVVKWVRQANRQGPSSMGKIIAPGSKGPKSEYFIAYRRLEGTPDPTISVGLLVPMQELVGQLNTHEQTIGLTTIIALALGLIVGWLISLAVTRPLSITVQQLAKVRAMELDMPPTPGSMLIEVDELANSVNHMKLGLNSFSRFVPLDLIQRVLATGTEPVIGGEQRELSIYFCDIVDFVGLAEQLKAADLLNLLGEYLGDLSQGISESGGTIDKYIGDSIMAFWGAPEPQENHAELACRAMLQNQERMKSLRRRWQERGLPPVHVRMAVHTGKVIVGNIGSEQRLNYTVIGDSVNVASRLEHLNRLYGTQSLISDVTFLAVADKLVVRPIDFVRVKGRNGIVQIFEPLGFRDAMSKDELLRAEELVALSIDMLSYYRSRLWDEALPCLYQILAAYPDDGVALLFKKRCEHFLKNPPPPNWDGVDYTAKF